MKNILAVTGITGHSGKYFLQELINVNYSGTLRCLVRKSSNTEAIDNSGLNIEKVIGELPETEAINKLVNNADTVLHIANIHYSIPIVKAAVNANVRHVILVHTTGIYSKHKMASDEYKAIENSLTEYTNKILITILRPTMIFGDLCDHNIRKFIKMADVMPVIFEINHGMCKIQPVNARDLGCAYYQVINQATLTQPYYDLSGDHAITMHDLFLMIGQLLGKNIKFINVPLKIAVMAAKLLNFVSFGRANYIEKVLRMGEDRDFQHIKATEDFKFCPEPFEKGLKREVEQYLYTKKDISVRK